MPTTTDAPGTSELRTIPLSSINVVEGFNPRRRFDQAELDRLADSIRLRGLLQPLVVTPDGDDSYRLVAGERRYHACGKAALMEVPAIVRPAAGEGDGLDDALVENMARVDLTPVEEAYGFQRLLDQGLTRKGVAEALSVSQRLVTERLLILGIDAALHGLIGDGTIPPSAIKPLAQLSKIHPDLTPIAVKRVTTVHPDDHYYGADVT